MDSLCIKALAMNAEQQQQLKVKRVSTRKRPRDSLRSQMTPARKKGTGRDKGILNGSMDDQIPTEFCSDNEDLFGDYDSILGDSSLMAKLDSVEQTARTKDPPQAVDSKPVDNKPVDQPKRGFTELRSLKNTDLQRPSDDHLTDSILDVFKDESFGDLPSAQQLDIEEKDLRTSDILQKDKTSTPLRTKERTSECRTKMGGTNTTEGQTSAGFSKARRSMTDHLKRAMLSNAGAPSNVSRTKVLKEAVVSEEINVAMQAMEKVSTVTTDLGPFFGLPTKVKELIHKLRGINDLYDWQKTCLNLDCVRERRNLIYSLPTSGGKTLVAEVLILKELLCRKKDCLFILPYISLVQEKVRGLAGFGLELDFMVEEYAGSKGRFPPVKRRNKNSLYIATIEKGHSLVNSLIENDRLDNLGMVVVDELHMLGDGSRGAIIEMTLAKVLYMSKTTQIIGMSATLGNIKDIQKFLRAENYTNDFRPVQLSEYVKLSNTIYEVAPKEEDCFKFSRLLNFKYSSSMQQRDPDHIIALVTEVIPAYSCLVFCPTQKNCENVAGMICKYLKEEFLVLKEKEKGVLLRELKASGSGMVCPVLRKVIPYGLAYHHGGLTGAERRLVEDAYSSGVLCLLACTSTLAAGINLPARRVILRSPYVAADFLKRSQYKQMVGRAGRAGIDTVGESILILQDKDTVLAKKLVSAPMETCYSNLTHNEGKGVLSLILSIIGLKMTTTPEQVKDFMSSTLLCVQQERLCAERGLTDRVQDSLVLLQEMNLISVTQGPQGDALEITTLGRATYKSSVDLTKCDVLYKDLSKGLESLMLNSHLHLLYLVTPYDMIAQCKPDWMAFFRQFSLLSASEQKMSATVGVPESFVARKAAGQTVKKSVNMASVHRLYLALVLYTLLKETNLWSVAERFSLSRGFIQSLLSSSAAFCACVQHFTEEFEEFWPFKSLLAELSKRLSYCVTAELVPLMEVAGVLEYRAKQLFNAGYKTLSHLANADPSTLSNAVENLNKKQATMMVASAKMLLNDKASALQEEVDELLMLPLDLPVP
ncbi:helicase POLQ-like [Gadus morhua]|uniref:Helicase, POLQ like n=1 Tax=Gadus morhua TaxID=8049 RepID=A0A8C5AIG4_GADMO|nr:helicase POLQ-like [Gadus morhua]